MARDPTAKENMRWESWSDTDWTAFNQINFSQVDDIVGHKKEKGKTLFRIRWKGYSADQDTWQAANDLTCKNLLKRYKKKMQKSTKDVYNVSFKTMKGKALAKWLVGQSLRVSKFENFHTKCWKNEFKKFIQNVAS